MVRRGMRDFLELHDDLEVVGEAADGAEAVELVAGPTRRRLMDLLMPGIDGIEATRRIKAAQPEVEVVALTSFIEEDRVVGAIEAGAAGFLLKDAEADDLAAAIRAAAPARSTSTRPSPASSPGGCGDGGRGTPGRRDATTAPPC